MKLAEIMVLKQITAYVLCQNRATAYASEIIIAVTCIFFNVVFLTSFLLMNYIHILFYPYDMSCFTNCATNMSLVDLI